MGYRDFLQSPLQPLQDNLESQTYETFERDDTKYTTYEQAVYRCLLDRVPQVRGRVGGARGRAGGLLLADQVADCCRWRQVLLPLVVLINLGCLEARVVMR